MKTKYKIKWEFQLQFFRARKLISLLGFSAAIIAPVYSSPNIAMAQIAEDAPVIGVLHPIFQDNSVLQRGIGTKIYGKIAPNSAIKVEFQGKSYESRADNIGNWSIVFDSLKEGGPYQLLVTTNSETITLKNVLVGDVFLCAGQSNMQFMVSQSRNADEEINKSKNDNIRLLNLERRNSAVPLETFASKTIWQSAEPSSVRNFSAACYFMGREVNKSQNVPVGLINSSWGGSIIHDWVPERVLSKRPEFVRDLETLRAYGRDKNAAINEVFARSKIWAEANDIGYRAEIKFFADKFSHADWPQVNLPGNWEGLGKPEMANLDGVVYFRRNISLSQNDITQDAILSLGSIDERDETFFNGVKIGENLDYRVERKYTIPKALLRIGENNITIRAIDWDGGGGLRSSPDKLKLVLGEDKEIPLVGAWHYKVAGDFKRGFARPPFVPWTGAKGYTTIYNGMIRPIAPYNLRGYFWYQGEQNAHEADKYHGLLKDLINEWRAEFKNQAPFVIVQLANFGGQSNVPTENGFAQIRNVQRLVSQSVPNTGLVVAIDVGNPRDVHPTEKQEIGQRGKLEFDRLSYSKPNGPASPVPVSAIRRGQHIEISFERANEDFITLSSNRVIGFELCQTKTNCRFVDAQINGRKILINDAQANSARFIRFAWAGTPVMNLYTKSKLPFSPFEIGIENAK